jgi:5,6,7,8-tetrahydromethanopterin hydro-lyase
MAKITKLCIGESLVGEGNEVAHIDLIIGPRGSAAETAFANALTNNKEGFTTLLAVVAPNLLCKPATILFNKVTIKGAKQAVQMFGPAQHAVAKAVADSVAEGVIPESEADDLFICVGVFIHWDASWPVGGAALPPAKGLQRPNLCCGQPTFMQTGGD